MIFLPILFGVGLVVALAGHARAVAAQNRMPQLPPPSPEEAHWYKPQTTASVQQTAMSGQPQPLDVLGACVMAGRFPPPQVIAGALAQAASIGRPDLEHMIVHNFIKPTVDRARGAHVGAESHWYTPPEAQQTEPDAGASGGSGDPDDDEGPGDESDDDGPGGDDDSGGSGDQDDGGDDDSGDSGGDDDSGGSGGAGGDSGGAYGASDPGPYVDSAWQAARAGYNASQVSAYPSGSPFGMAPGGSFGAPSASWGPPPPGGYGPPPWGLPGWGALPPPPQLPTAPPPALPPSVMTPPAPPPPGIRVTNIDQLGDPAARPRFYGGGMRAPGPIPMTLSAPVAAPPMSTRRAPARFVPPMRAPLPTRTATPRSGMRAAGDLIGAPPIEGVAPPAWSAFLGKLAREAPSFKTDRHVGKFRQRRDRLAELGLTEGDLANEYGQEKAIAKDLADAYRHARAGELVSHVGQAIDVDGAEVTVTLSGLLGTISAAGLEGAASWLEDASDRKRFPGTTGVFLRTNGVF
jgi:hypothetical protein